MYQKYELLFSTSSKKGFRNVFAVFDNEVDYLQLSGELEFLYSGLKHFSNWSQVKKAQYIQFLNDNKKILNNQTGEHSQKVWFLRPKNDMGSYLFNTERDYSTVMDYSDENIQNIIDSVFRVIVYGDSGKN